MLFTGFKTKTWYFVTFLSLCCKVIYSGALEKILIKLDEDYTYDDDDKGRQLVFIVIPLKRTRNLQLLANYWVIEILSHVSVGNMRECYHMWSLRIANIFIGLHVLSQASLHLWCHSNLVESYLTQSLWASRVIFSEHLDMTVAQWIFLKLVLEHKTSMHT